ncbi:FAD synthetase [Nymphaea thermarum]|nr:FAD synthetase [Nymphaea thermarum]
MGFASLSLRPFAQPLHCRNRCMCCRRTDCFSGRKMLKVLCLPMKITSFCYSQSVYMNSKEVVEDKLLIDCGPDQECVIGGIVALGKFEALHVGHRELAIQASKAGTPFLLSFIGMAEVLGWAHKAPIVANCDRKRVLASWAPLCGNMVPLEYHVNFPNVRYLSPQQFVERLSKELGVSGVVAGENYRFGYKAAGDSSDLARLCEEYGLAAYIVRPVMDKLQICNGVSFTNGKEKGQVSSTRVRHALASGNMEYVSQLLGRSHRLFMTNTRGHVVMGSRLSLPTLCLMNQQPKEGSYSDCTLYVDGFVGDCNVVIDATHIHIETESWPPLEDKCLISVEFNGSAPRES